MTGRAGGGEMRRDGEKEDIKVRGRRKEHGEGSEEDEEVITEVT